ncbi:MAG TPA: FAD-binding protein [Acidimicrobiales bacterium]|nr:FAD-binding protein [Acidimicrobiales bacterium]
MDLIARFAEEVGPAGPVAVEGGRTHWEVGGLPHPATRLVRAPSGVVAHHPEEMIVRVRAGTPVAELDAALAERGQMVPLDPHEPGRATVGGVLAVGRSGPRRLRWGPVRDLLLEARFVSAEGRLVRAGGPVVKNVTGFDLCRLLVGSLGTLGLLAEVVLRTHPRPAARRWLASRQALDGPQATAALRRLWRPSSFLWDGERAWVLLEGHPADVDAEAARLGAGFEPVADGPKLPQGGRLSLRPGQLEGLSGWGRGRFVAELGVGVVHCEAPQAASRPGRGLGPLHQRVRRSFDPQGRLNPGREVA